MFDDKHFARFADFVLNFEDACYEFIIYEGHKNIQTNKIVKSNYNIAYAGWYDRADLLKSHAKRLSGVSGYVTFNPVNRNLFARSANDVIKLGKGEGTKAEDINLIRFLFIDIDVDRKPSGISSTTDELLAAIEVRKRILADHEWIKNASIWGSSGNGGYILCRLDDLPNDKNTRSLIDKTLASLAYQYGRKGAAKVHVDVTTPSHPNAHLPLPGTMKCKGSDVKERPWRMVTVDGGY